MLWDNINSCFHQCDKILEGSKARRSLSHFRCWSSSCQGRHEALRVAGVPWSDLGRWRSRGLELLSDAVRLQGLPPASPSARTHIPKALNSPAVVPLPGQSVQTRKSVESIHVQATAEFQ